MTSDGDLGRVRVLIADDQALVRRGFRLILEAEDDIDVVGEAEDGVDAVRLARDLRPDVALLDIRMPRLDGLEAARRVLADSPHGRTRVLMLTTFDLDEYVYDALCLGASGFLLKDTPPEQLADGIRAVARGEALLAPSVTRRLIQEFTRNPPPRPSTRGRTSLPFSPLVRRRCSGCSPGDGRTRRSPMRCSWARRRSRRT